VEVPNQPQLSLRQVGGRFGFSPPIVPPGTEPDLQALNNSFVAAANSASQEARGDHHVIPVATSDDDDLSRPVLSRAPSVTMAPQSHPRFYETIDPTLRLISQETQGDRHVIPIATSNDADLS
jgi:hypothetical protein